LNLGVGGFYTRSFGGFWPSFVRIAARMFEICRTCGQPVASNAAQCPHCGDEDPLAPLELGEDVDDFGTEDFVEFDETGAEVPRTAGGRSGEPASWRDHYDRGLELIHSQQVDEAIVELTQALVEAPDESLAECYAHRGYAYLTSDQFQRAIDDCQQAIASNARMAEAYAWRGAAYAGLRRWREAILDYVEAIRLARDPARQEYEEIAKSYADRRSPNTTARFATSRKMPGCIRTAGWRWPSRGTIGGRSRISAMRFGSTHKTAFLSCIVRKCTRRPAPPTRRSPITRRRCDLGSGRRPRFIAAGGCCWTSGTSIGRSPILRKR
jgi:hypothetical protein